MYSCLPRRSVRSYGVVKIFAFLELEQKWAFFKGLSAKGLEILYSDKSWARIILSEYDQHERKSSKKLKW